MISTKPEAFDNRKVRVSRNHSYDSDVLTLLDSAVWIDVDTLGAKKGTGESVSLEDARAIRDKLTEIIDNIDGLVEAAKPKNSDIIAELPIGSLFRVVNRYGPEEATWTRVFEGARPQQNDRKMPFVFFNEGTWSIKVEYRNDQACPF